MITTESEKIITNINTNIFFREFTFNKNSFDTNTGNTKEFAVCSGQVKLATSL